MPTLTGLQIHFQIAVPDGHRVDGVDSALGQTGPAQIRVHNDPGPVQDAGPRRTQQPQTAGAHGRNQLLVEALARGDRTAVITQPGAQALQLLLHDTPGPGAPPSREKSSQTRIFKYDIDLRDFAQTGLEV